MPEIYQPEEDSFLLSKVLDKKIPGLLQKKPNIKILEIGSGSGIQLKKIYEKGIKKENIYSCDINPDAVKKCNSLGFNCIESNLFNNIKKKYDLILFNPPYLPEDLREPKKSQIATTGGKKGSELINKFLKQAKKHLNENGKILLLVSNLTKGINFTGYNKKIIARKKIFFEELSILELKRT